MQQDLAELVRNHQASVWRYLRYLGCEPAEADDLTQETFLTVWRRSFDDHGHESTGAYLRTVAKNLFLMARRSDRIPRVEQDVLLAASEDAVWERFVRDSRPEAWIDALRSCVDRLYGGDDSGDKNDAVSERRTAAESTNRGAESTEAADGPRSRTRLALDLCYRQGRSRTEIAVTLGIGEEGVKTLLRRAREALRRCVERKVERKIGT